MSFVENPRKDFERLIDTQFKQKLTKNIYWVNVFAHLILSSYNISDVSGYRESMKLKE